MNVFVLCTGRNGSLTFTRACQNITNFSAGHETRTKELGGSRFDYPENHIEADNRLSWFLGKLEQKYGSGAFYVHLVRDREKTAASYNRKWIRNGSIMRAYTEGVLQTSLDKISRTRRMEICRDYYDTVNSNIELFLKDKPSSLTIHLEKIQEEFTQFWKSINAEGDLEAALQVFDKNFNATKRGKLRYLKHELIFRVIQVRRKIW